MFGASTQKKNTGGSNDKIREAIQKKLDIEGLKIGNKPMDVCMDEPPSWWSSMWTITCKKNCFSHIELQNGQKKKISYDRQISYYQTEQKACMMDTISITNANIAQELNIPLHILSSNEPLLPEVFPASVKVEKQWMPVLFAKALFPAFTECKGTLQASRWHGDIQEHWTRYQVTIDCVLSGRPSLAERAPKRGDYRKVMWFNAKGRHTSLEESYPKPDSEKRQRAKL